MPSQSLIRRSRYVLTAIDRLSIALRSELLGPYVIDCSGEDSATGIGAALASHGHRGSHIVFFFRAHVRRAAQIVALLAQRDLHTLRHFRKFVHALSRFLPAGIQVNGKVLAFGGHAPGFIRVVRRGNGR